MAEWKKITCAIDLSDPARLAMESAAELARALGAELTLLYVHEPAPLAAVDLLVTPQGVAELSMEETEEALAGWRATAAEISAAPVRSIIRTGPAAAEILAHAREQGADLLVLGTHGRKGLAKLAFGSVAEKVAKQAPCPVLLVRPRAVSEADDIATEARWYQPV
ncbi:universal stress protein [Anaeromyxobacter oryzae]|uniref:Universal stress protein n=1 Tax=Anaeromyxobacter oryzae TaxID=2918170 RepID=A0ABM7X0I7_9BACT|nr:universal stress protein [Anaeromyxobacter oryzae]BDG05227.1 universal stress protein [Anaeromyxobacter oryzae]